MTYKKLKASARLGYRVGQTGLKNSQQLDQHGDKLTAFENAKYSLAFFY
jgi:hypothetical protein